MQWRSLVFCLLIALPQAHAAAPERIVSLGGSVTEIVYDLGQGDRLVASDESSLYPAAALKLPRVGYYRTVPLEGIISMRPDLVLASENAGPKKTLDRLSGLGLDVQMVSDGPTLDSLYLRIQQIADELLVPQEGRELTQRLQKAIGAAQAVQSRPLRTLVLLNRTGPLMAAGRNTAANAVLELAGLTNAMAEQAGYKPITAEGLALLAPDLIVITTASAQASGGMEKFMASAGVASTPAGRDSRVLAMDDMLILGIGPRVAQAIQQLKGAAKEPAH